MMYKLNTGSTSNYYNWNTITYNYNGSGTITYNPYDNYTINNINSSSFEITYAKNILTAENVANTSFVPNAEEKIEEYIYENFDKYDILEMQEYIYQVIQEKAYDIVTEMLEDAKEDYDITNEDDVIETIIDNINFDSLYEIVDEIIHSPRTMEEKLADVGMSYKDFL